MRRWFVLWLFAALFAGAAMASAQEAGSMEITPASLHDDVYTPLDVPWRIQLGDDPSWAAVDVDESTWASVDTVLESGQVPEGFDGTAWFRLRLHVSKDVSRDELALRVRGYGAFEVYVNGERVLRLDDSAEYDIFPRHRHVRLTRGETHVIAVRLVNPGWSHFASEGIPIGFHVEIAPLRTARVTAARSETVFQQVQAALIGAGAALGLLHLLMLLFYPAQRSNLYFAGLSLSFVFTHSLSQVINIVETASALETSLYFFKTGLTLVAATSVQTFHALLGKPTAKLTRALIFVATALILASPWLRFDLYFLVVLAAMIECVRVTVMGVIRKREGAWLIAFGCTLFVAANLFTVFRYLLFKSTEQTTIPGWGVVALLLCISATLAREFAQGKRAELEKAALHAKQAELVQSEKMAAMGVLVAGIAHEVNTPLAAIQSAGASLTATNDKLNKWILKNVPEEQRDKKLTRTLGVARDSADIVSSATDRVSDIVQRLKDFAKLDEAAEQRSDLNEAVTTTLATVQHQLEGVEVHTELGEIPVVMCTPRQINQALTNLILNAAESITGDGAITITSRQADENVVIEVTDTGEGIEDDHLAKIFDPGFTTKGVGVGAGLGLAIAHQIVTDHDGTIEVTSRPGVGSTFTITLPVK